MTDWWAQLRAHLLWNGMSPDDLDKISHADAMNCWHLYQQGMAGPTATYLTSYPIMAMLNKLCETLVAVNSKNYRPTPMEDFDKVFPQVYDVLTLKKRRTASDLSLRAQATMALPGAPEWLTKALQEEIDDGRADSIN